MRDFWESNQTWLIKASFIAITLIILAYIIFD